MPRYDATDACAMRRYAVLPVLLEFTAFIFIICALLLPLLTCRACRRHADDAPLRSRADTRSAQKSC